MKRVHIEGFKQLISNSDNHSQHLALLQRSKKLSGKKSLIEKQIVASSVGAQQILQALSNASASLNSRENAALMYYTTDTLQVLLNLIPYLKRVC